MLVLELNGQRYSKKEHRSVLATKLDGRSDGSIEFKHANTSAVLVQLGYPFINGYKPRYNVQQLLREVVEEQVVHNTTLQAAAEHAVQQPAVAATVTDWAKVIVERPHGGAIHEPEPEYTPRFSPAQRDYLSQEARNRSLGQAGEEFVLEMESRRLHEAGQKRLANRVEHVAATQGDGLGFDVLSFENSGKERLIEVKTTRFGKATPFYATRNEVARSEADRDKYHVYRLFNFRDKPQAFVLPGAIEENCQLDPVSYRARLLAGS